MNLSFPQARRPLLRALDNFTQRFYLSRHRAKALLYDLLREHLFDGSTVFSYMQQRLEETTWLDTQGARSSQRRVLELVDEVLDERCKGLRRLQPDEPSTAVYLDDCSFTGTTTARAFRGRDHNGIAGAVRPSGRLLVLHMLAYVDGRSRTWFLRDWDTPPRIEMHAGKGVGSTLRLRPIRQMQDVLSAEALEYWDDVRCGPRAFLPSGALGDLEDREIVTRELFERGVALRRICGNLRPKDRPLGFTWDDDFGFGSPVVTYANCPNTAPLALWAGTDALFPRHNRHVSERPVRGIPADTTRGATATV